jgi:hypothetical protein
MKHKHYDCIVAWAEGKKIQVFSQYKKEWNDCPSPTPAWNSQLEYRIKPEPKPDVVRYARASFTEYSSWSSEEHDRNLLLTRTFWSKSKSGSDNVKAIFDGETGKLKSVEIIND